MNIHKAEAQALDANDLRGMINVEVNFIDYDDLKDMTLNQVLSKNGMAIILMHIHNSDGSKRPVGHWIALLEYEDHIEHFDSYGLKIDEELHITHEKPYLGELLKGKNVKQDHVRIQEIRNDVNTCGRHCVVRCMTKSVAYEQYIQFLRSLSGVPDESVTLMTFFSH